MNTKAAASSPTSDDRSVAARYDVFVVENYEDGKGSEKSSWTRLGATFPHKDAKGFNVELRAVPISGKLVIRLHEPSDKMPVWNRDHDCSSGERELNQVLLDGDVAALG